jgi:hypothetical protein
VDAPPRAAHLAARAAFVKDELIALCEALAAGQRALRRLGRFAEADAADTAFTLVEGRLVVGDPGRALRYVEGDSSAAPASPFPSGPAWS